MPEKEGKQLAYFFIFSLIFFYFQVPLMDPGKPMPEKEGKQRGKEAQRGETKVFFSFFHFFFLPRQGGATRRNKGAEGLELQV